MPPLLDRLTPLLQRSTAARRLAAGGTAAVALAVVLLTVGRVVPATLDGLLLDLSQLGGDASGAGPVALVTVPNTDAGSPHRADLARLHDRLLKAGAAAVVLQVPLDQANDPRDLNQVRTLIDSLGAGKDPALQTRLRGWAEELDHDARLERALAGSGRTVLAAFPAAAASASSQRLTALPRLTEVDTWVAGDAVAPMARFAAHALVGLERPRRVDADGVRRREAMYFTTSSGPVASLPLAAWLAANGLQADQVAGGSTELAAGTHRLPLAGDAEWIPRYQPPATLTPTAARAWLGNGPDPAAVAGRVVLVCTRSAMEATTGGRQLQACDGAALRIASLLGGDYLLAPWWSKAALAVAWLVGLGLAAFALPPLSAAMRLALVLGHAVVIVALESWLLATGLVVPLMSSVVLVAALAPWLWRVRAPDRPIGEVIAAAVAAPPSIEDERRRQARRNLDSPPPPARPEVDQSPALAAAEVARASRLGVADDGDDRFGSAAVVTQAIGTQRVVPPAPPRGLGPNDTRPVKSNQPRESATPTSLRALSDQLQQRMVDPSSADVADLLLGRVKRPPKPRLGRYELDRELGRGAMGTVYIARDPQINRVVALKAIPLTDEFSERDLAEIKSRFFREAEMAGKLAHPRIVTVFDAGEDSGIAYIAMEYVRGRTLGDYTAPDRLLRDSEVLEVVARVAEGLDYAHQNGVVHRDIKPGNIIYDIENGTTKITDFGIARVTNSTSTRTGVVLGTPSFMSPEQLEGRTVKGTSDLFSLGVTLFQLLTGQLPFRADSMTGLMDKIANTPHPPLRSIRPDLPAAVGAVIDRALEKDPERRYQSGLEMAKALRSCVPGSSATDAAGKATRDGRGLG